MYKNIRAFKMPRSFVCVDLETSDFLENGGGIIEIGAVKVIDGIITDKFGSLCKLSVGDHWSNKAQRVHGISKLDLKDAPSKDEVIKGFNDFCEDYILLAHNGDKFDKPFLLCEAAKHGVLIDNDWHDSMKDYKNVVGPKCSLKAMCNHFHVDNNHAHRAVEDAEATAKCYLLLIEEAKLLSEDVRDIDVEKVDDVLSGEYLTVTMETNSLSKRHAFELAKAHGAVIQNNVTKKTTMLLDMCPDGVETSKIRKAEKYGVSILSENDFRDLINEQIETHVSQIVEPEVNIELDNRDYTYLSETNNEEIPEQSTIKNEFDSTYNSYESGSEYALSTGEKELDSVRDSYVSVDDLSEIEFDFNDNSNTTSYYVSNNSQDVQQSSGYRINKTLYIAVCWFFGFIGGQYFITKHFGKGILSFLFCWTYIPFFIGLVRGFKALFKKADNDGCIFLEN